MMKLANRYKRTATESHLYVKPKRNKEAQNQNGSMLASAGMAKCRLDSANERLSREGVHCQARHPSSVLEPTGWKEAAESCGVSSACCSLTMQHLPPQRTYIRSSLQCDPSILLWLKIDCWIVDSSSNCWCSKILLNTNSRSFLSPPYSCIMMKTCKREKENIHFIVGKGVRDRDRATERSNIFKGNSQ